MPEAEAPRKINVGLVVGGGAVIAASAAAAYYIYSKNQLINEYVTLVKSYEEEYQDYWADGVPPNETEQEKLDFKVDRLEYLEWLIAQKGWLHDLITALAKLGIVFIGYKITVNVIKYLWKRHPPGGQIPTYPCPQCDEVFDTEYQLKRHMEEHPVIDPSPAADVWPLIQQLPSWIINMIGVVGEGSVLLAENIAKAWGDIPLEVQIALIILVLVAVVIIMAITFSFLSPALSPVAVGLALCL